MTPNEPIEPAPVPYEEAAAHRAPPRFYVRTKAARAALQEWLARKIERLPRVIARERELLKTHGDSGSTARQIDYWVAYQSAVRHLIYQVGRLRISRTKGIEVDANVGNKKPSRRVR